MKPNVLLAVVTVAFAVSAGACFWLIQTFAPGMGSIGMLLDADIVVKLSMFTIILAAAPALIGGLIGMRPRVYVAGGAAVVLGLLGALYGEMNTQAALRAVGPVSFAVTAPSRAESLFCLSLGLFVALMALGLLKLRAR